MTVDTPAPNIVFEYQGKPINIEMEKEELKDIKVLHFDKNKKFDVTFNDGWINPEVFNSAIVSAEIPMTNSDISKIMKELQELKTRVNKTVALVHNCQRCGATLEVDEHKSIFCCKYCGATYLLGSVQPNSVYN